MFPQDWGSIAVVTLYQGHSRIEADLPGTHRDLYLYKREHVRKYVHSIVCSAGLRSFEGLVHLHVTKPDVTKHFEVKLSNHRVHFSFVPDRFQSMGQLLLYKRLVPPMPYFTLASNHNFRDSPVHKVVVEEDPEANIREEDPGCSLGVEGLDYIRQVEVDLDCIRQGVHGWAGRKLVAQRGMEPADSLTVAGRLGMHPGLERGIRLGQLNFLVAADQSDIQIEENEAGYSLESLPAAEKMSCMSLKGCHHCLPLHPNHDFGSPTRWIRSSFRDRQELHESGHHQYLYPCLFRPRPCDFSQL